MHNLVNISRLWCINKEMLSQNQTMYNHHNKPTKRLLPLNIIRVTSHTILNKNIKLVITRKDFYKRKTHILLNNNNNNYNKLFIIAREVRIRIYKMSPPMITDLGRLWSFLAKITKITKIISTNRHLGSHTRTNRTCWNKNITPFRSRKRKKVWFFILPFLCFLVVNP